MRLLLLQYPSEINQIGSEGSQMSQKGQKGRLELSQLNNCFILIWDKKLPNLHGYEVFCLARGYFSYLNRACADLCELNSKIF